MRFNAFLTMLIFVSPVLAQEEGFEFREPLYFSDVDREQRTPQAVRVGGVVFVSAFSGSGETLKDQVRVTYMRLQSVLGNYGLNMGNVAQERIYIRSGQSVEVLAEIRLAYYEEMEAPASTIVEVAGFPDSRALVSIELIAVVNPESY